MCNVAIVKIHPGLNMAIPQLSGDLTRAGHNTRMVFFKEYVLEDYLESSFADDTVVLREELFTEFGEDYDLLEKTLREFDPAVIGLSVISLSVPEAIKTTQFLRSKFDVPIIWGGVGTTLQPEIAIQHADLVCVGEGEEVMIEFADCIDSGSDWTNIEGTWVKSPDGEVIKHPKRASGPLDDIAIPDWDMSKVDYLTSNKVVGGKEAYELITDGDYQLMTQRGCPFSCSFCVESRYQEMFGKKNSLRRRNVDVVIEELVAAKEQHNPRCIYFWDDVFTLNPRWLKEFLPRYKEEVDIPFWCYTYPTTHDLGLLKDIKEAGCKSLSMGIQSGSERVLKEVYNRPTPLDRVIEASQEIVDAGLIGYFDLITRSEFETEEDLRSTFNFLIDLPQEMAYIGAGDMKSYPTYSYTRRADAAKKDNIVTAISRVEEKVYDYYHRLYWVARNPHIDKDEKLAIGSEPYFREQPELLDQYIFRRLSPMEGVAALRRSVRIGKHPNELFADPDYVHVPYDPKRVAQM